MVVQLIQLVVAVGLSLLAGYLLSKKNRSLVQDDKPTTLATRGSYIPLIKGRRRIGSVFGYAGIRSKVKEKPAGGKGDLFSGPKVDVYYEDGWQLLCVGPVWALHEIEENGVPIFHGPITAVSHPSGSLIDVGKAGKFRIFWGEINQPVNTYLGDPARLGVESRWPQCCYIEWRQKRLGQNPVWPTLTYTVETRPQTAHLVNSIGYIPETFILSTNPGYTIFAVQNGSPGVGYFQVVSIDGWGEDDAAKPGMKIRVVGNVGLGVDTDFTIRSVAQLDIGSGLPTPPPYGPPEVILVWRVYVDETITGASNTGVPFNGTIVPYVGQRDDGWNAAHLLAELLFETWPLGLGLDKTEWDMQSLEDFGVLTDPAHENLRCSTIAPDAQDMRGILGALMQDFGLLLPLNMTTGLIQFYPVRKPVGVLPTIDEDAMLARPEITAQTAERPVDRLIFSFSEESNVYRDVTVAIDEDGHASRQEYYRARTVQIVAATHFDTAARIAERRSFEEMAGAAVVRLQLGRAARSLLPGQPMIVDGFEEVLRVSETKHDPLSGQVDTTFTTDFYGAPLSSFLAPNGVTAGNGNEVEIDLAFRIVELPEVLVGAGGPTSVVMLAIRAHGLVSAHNIHLSANNSTYTFYSEDGTIVTGGTLIDALPLDSAMEVATGPTFNVLGPDINSTLDLSSDSVSWRGGRQLAVFVNASREVMVAFVKKTTAISGTVYRLDGLILNRYDTRPISLPAGSVVFVLQNDDGLIVQDSLVAPETLLYAKSEPLGVGTVPLSSLAPETLFPYGKGVRPIPVSGIRLDTGGDASGGGTTNWGSTYYAVAGSAPADDLIVQWSYSTPQTTGSGAGAFGWGSLVGDAVPEGDFYIEILDASDVVKRTSVVSSPSYTYTRTDRLADFTTEPATFKVRVTQRRGGYSSSTVTQTFTKTN